MTGSETSGEAQEMEDKWGGKSEEEYQQKEPGWMQGEKCSTTQAQTNTEKLPDVDVRIKIGKNWFLDDEIPKGQEEHGTKLDNPQWSVCKAWNSLKLHEHDKKT